jgi:hypothetical protein
MSKNGKKFINTTEYNRTPKHQEAAKEFPFERIDMRAINDDRFKPQHLGLLMMLLAQKDGTGENSDGEPFIINKGEILHRFDIKNPYKYKPWDDLEEWGYIISYKNGKGTHYIINEIPNLHLDQKIESKGVELTKQNFDCLQNTPVKNTPAFGTAV